MIVRSRPVLVGGDPFDEAWTTYEELAKLRKLDDSITTVIVVASIEIDEKDDGEG